MQGEHMHSPAGETWEDSENSRERQRDPESKRRIQRNSPYVDQNHAGTMGRGFCRVADRC